MSLSDSVSLLKWPFVLHYIAAFALSYDLTHDFAQLARKGVLNVLRGVPPK